MTTNKKQKKVDSTRERPGRKKRAVIYLLITSNKSMTHFHPKVVSSILIQQRTVSVHGMQKTQSRGVVCKNPVSSLVKGCFSISRSRSVANLIEFSAIPERQDGSSTLTNIPAHNMPSQRPRPASTSPPLSFHITIQYVQSAPHQERKLPKTSLQNFAPPFPPKNHP